MKASGAGDGGGAPAAGGAPGSLERGGTAGAREGGRAPAAADTAGARDGGGGTAPSAGATGEIGEARSRILGRVRSALAERERVAHPGALSGEALRGGADGEALVAGFAEALGRGGGEVVLLDDLAQARAWLRDFAAAFSRAAASPEVPPALRPDLREAPPAEAELGVSLARAAAAATGSLVLSSAEGRALQLLPPVHLVWVEATAVRPGLEEALEHARSLGDLPAVLALHSGPSKSADIGRILVTGVHGPGRLVAAVARFPLAGS